MVVVKTNPIEWVKLIKVVLSELNLQSASSEKISLMRMAVFVSHSSFNAEQFES